MSVKASSAEITLDFPIKIEGVEVGSLTLRRPKQKDLKAASLGTSTDAQIEEKLFSNLLQITPADRGELDMSDYRKLQEAYMGFQSPLSAS